MTEAEQTIEDGLAVQELLRSEGWKVLERELNREIESETSALKDIETDGRSPEVIGTEYVSHVQLRRGLQRAKGIINDIIARKEEAQETHHG